MLGLPDRCCPIRSFPGHLAKASAHLAAGEVASLEKLWNQQCTKENVIAKIQEALVKPNVKGQPCEDCYKGSRVFTAFNSGLIIAFPTGGSFI